MLRSIIANWSVVVVSALAVLITYPLLLGRIGQEAYGFWLMLTSVASYFSMLQMGVPMANVRFLAKYLGLGDEKKAEAVMSTNFTFFSVVGLATFGFGFPVAYLLPAWIAIPESIEPWYYATVLIVFAEVASRFCFECFEGTLHAKQAFVPLAAIRVLGTAMRLIGFYEFVVDAQDFVTLGIVVFLSTLSQSLAIYWVARRLTPTLRPRLFHVDRTLLKEVLSFSSTVLSMNVASRINTATAPLIVGTIVSTAAVVPFAAASSIMAYVSELVVGVSNVVMPQVSKRESTLSLDQWGGYFFELSRRIALFLVPLVSGVIVFGDTFLSLWLGNQVAESAYAAIVALAIGTYALAALRGAAMPILAGTSNLKEIARVQWAISVLGILLGAAIGLRYGVVGVACGLAAAQAVGAAGVYAVARHHLRFNTVSFLQQTQAVAFPQLVGQLGIGWIVDSWLRPDDLTTLCLAGFCFASSYAVALLCTLTRDERDATVSFLRNLLLRTRTER